MAPHSSTLAWKIPWIEEPGRLQSMGSLRVGHDWATSLSFFTFMHWRRKWQPLQCSCLENPKDGGGWWAAIYGVTESQTRLKWLSSSSSSQSPNTFFFCMIFCIWFLQEYWFRLLPLVKKSQNWTSMEVQWLRLHLPKQEVWVQLLVRELRSHMPCG